MAKTKKDSAEEPIEKQLWKTADKLRKNIDAAEYKHIVLGLVFLKYNGDAFAALYNMHKVAKGECAAANPEEKGEFKVEKVYDLPPVGLAPTASHLGTQSLSLPS